MRNQMNAMLRVSMLCVALGGCASNNSPQLPYPYGAPPPPAPPAGVQPGTAPPPTAGAPFPNLTRPNWGSPGTIAQQRDLATRFDPYGDNDAGPMIEGGRPREFARPQAQPARSSSYRNRFNPFAY
jgi:hypothetical protein